MADARLTEGVAVRLPAPCPTSGSRVADRVVRAPAVVAHLVRTADRFCLQAGTVGVTGGPF